MPNESTAAEQGADTQAAENQTAEDNKDTTQASQNTEDNKAGETPKSFTQEEVNRLLAKERRDSEKRAKAAEEKAKLSEDQRLQAELAETKAQLAERDRRDYVVAEARKAGINNPDLFYKGVRDDLDIDEKSGKITNLTELFEAAKTDYPQLYTAATQPKPAGSADGGSGKDGKQSLTKAEIDKMSPTEINENWEAVSEFLSSQK